MYRKLKLPFTFTLACCSGKYRRQTPELAEYYALSWWCAENWRLGPSGALVTELRGCSAWRLCPDYNKPRELYGNKVTIKLYIFHRIKQKQLAESFVSMLSFYMSWKLFAWFAIDLFYWIQGYQSLADMKFLFKLISGRYYIYIYI